MSPLFWFNVMEWIICLVMIPVIISRRMMPSAAVAWLAVVFFMPTIGLIAYLLIGTETLGRRRRRLHRQVMIRQRQRLPGARQDDDPVSREMRQQQMPMVVQTERVFGMPVTDGNRVELIDAYQAYVDRLIEDIEHARDHVHLLFYIFESDETGRRVAEALMAASKRGVICRVLADAAGSRGLFARRGLADEMRSAGVQVVAALPVSPIRRRLARMDLRNHRKIAVIDGGIAYTGSHNIVNEIYPAGERLRLTDLSARFTGPVVTQLQIVFIEDWAYETEEELGPEGLFHEQPAAGNVRVQTVPSGPNVEGETFRRVLLAAINAARSRLILTTPYLAPDEPTLLAISLAAQRGVEVELVTTEKSDYAIVSAVGRAFIDRLLDYGVRVHLFKPGLLHSKTMTVDDSFALLGSANIDMRSFNLNFEINTLLYGSQITRDLRAIQESYLKDSTEVSLEEWRARPRHHRWMEEVAVLLSPLL